MCMCVHAQLCRRVYLYMYICVYMCICVYMHMCITGMCIWVKLLSSACNELAVGGPRIEGLAAVVDSLVGVTWQLGRRGVPLALLRLEACPRLVCGRRHVPHCTASHKGQQGRGASPVAGGVSPVAGGVPPVAGGVSPVAGAASMKGRGTGWLVCSAGCRVALRAGMVGRFAHGEVDGTGSWALRVSWRVGWVFTTV